MLYVCHPKTEETDKRIQSQIKVTPPGLFRARLKKKWREGMERKGEEKPPVIKLKQHSYLSQGGWGRKAELRWILNMFTIFFISPENEFSRVKGRGERGNNIKNSCDDASRERLQRLWTPHIIKKQVTDLSLTLLLLNASYAILY